MQAPCYTLQEDLRQQAVNSYHIVDTEPEQEFDNITELAITICGVQHALLTILDKDRNWYKSNNKIPFKETPRPLSFCGHLIHNPHEIMIVEDARKDIRFHDNPIVTELKSVVFYLGVPILSEDGFAIGTLCIFDDKPRTLNDSQIASMKLLGKQAEHLLNFRKHKLKQSKVYNKLERTNEMLSEFAAVASHDLKLPIASIITTVDIIKTKYKTKVGKEGEERLNLIKDCSFTINEYITGMLDMYTSEHGIQESYEMINLKEFFDNLLKINLTSQKCQFWLPKELHVINSNKIALTQIFTNLFSNAVKYNDKDSCIISVSISENATHHKFSVTDNGPGIAKDNYKEIFKLFRTANDIDNRGKKGNGIGLSVVKKLVEKLNGKISVTSELGKFSTFSFTVEKPTTLTIN
jgi:hypothetical protein